MRGSAARGGIQSQSAAFTAPSAQPTEFTQTPSSSSSAPTIVFSKTTKPAKPPTRKPTIRSSSQRPSKSPTVKPSSFSPTTSPPSSYAPSASPSSAKVCLLSSCSPALQNCVPGAICSSNSKYNNNSPISAYVCVEDRSLLKEDNEDQEEEEAEEEASSSLDSQHCTPTGKPCNSKNNNPCCNPFALCTQGLFGSVGVCSLDVPGCVSSPTQAPTSNNNKPDKKKPNSGKGSN